jgi:hypothetical protein
VLVVDVEVVADDVVVMDVVVVVVLVVVDVVVVVVLVVVDVVVVVVVVVVDVVVVVVLVVVDVVVVVVLVVVVARSVRLAGSPRHSGSRRSTRASPSLSIPSLHWIVPHVGEQPSPAKRFPSSHASQAWRVPSPHEHVR